MRLNVGKRANHHSKVSIKRFDASDGFWIVAIESKLITVFDNSRSRQERFKFRRTTARSATRTTSAMRCRECLVKIEMNYVDAHVAWPCHTDQSIHVRTVHVDRKSTR